MDQIANMLSHIKNALAIRKKKVEIPHSKIKEEIAKLLFREGYVGKVNTFKIKGKPQKMISIELLYDDDQPKITHLKRISKPGLRIYKKRSDLGSVLGGFGTQIISTSSGMMTTKEARKRDLGGELICEVW